MYALARGDVTPAVRGPICVACRRRRPLSEIHMRSVAPEPDPVWLCDDPVGCRAHWPKEG